MQQLASLGKVMAAGCTVLSTMLPLEILAA
ncbi:hypothetical protein ACVWXO_000939 [Bradyrhizobium sp. LM2.7]